MGFDEGNESGALAASDPQGFWDSLTTLTSPSTYGSTPVASRSEWGASTDGTSWTGDRATASSSENYDKRGDVAGWQARATLGDGSKPFQANAGIGSYTDSGGSLTEGAGVDVGFPGMKGDFDCGNKEKLGFELQGPNATAGASATDSTAHFGEQVNLAGAAIQYGSSNAASNIDESGRLGVSVGSGFDVRAHYGDSDSDKLPEYGFGMDIGPVSFDVKSEDPVRSLMKAATGMFGPQSLAYDEKGKPTNLTKNLKDSMNELWDNYT